MNNWIQDLRYAARMLWKNRSFTTVAVITLALGIGANTAIFTVVNAVLLRPLPYPEADRLVWLTERHEEIPSRWVSYPNFLDWRSRNRSFEAMATIRGWQMTMTGDGEAQAVNARMVTTDYFRVMGASPQLGRDFNAEEDRFGAPAATVISHDFWQTQFGGDANVAGRSVTLNNQPFRVVGVMPPEFQHHGPPALWVLAEQYAAPAGPWFQRDNRVAGNVIARLRKGVSIEQARADMKSVEEHLVAEHPWTNDGNTIRLVSLQESIVGDTRLSLWLLFAAVGAVLLIGCANVANLLLARAATRQKEFAIRAALGASRHRVIRQLLVESLLLALVGGGLGLMLANAGVEALIKFAPPEIPRLSGVSIGWPVLAFTLLLSLLTGFVFGIAPAWQSTKTDLHETLKEGARAAGDGRGGRLRSLFVVAEIALAMVLLAGAGLMINSLTRLFASDPGFDSRQVVTMKILPREAYPTRPQSRQFHAQLLERLAALPGVEAVTVLNDIPGLEPAWQTDINPEINGQYQNIDPGALINVDWGIITADYFRVFRIPLTQGRTFTPQEVAEGAPVIIIDEHLAQKFWPDGDAIGQHIKYDSPTPIEIIGIAGNVRNYGTEALGRIKIYTPFGRLPLPLSNLAVRATGVDPPVLVAAIKGEVQSINPNVPISEVTTLENLLAAHVAPRRFNTWLLGLFAAIALLLAAVGIYGVMSYVAAQRTREFGIRLALGAQRGDVLRLMIGQSLRLGLVGLALGLSASLALTRWLNSFLFGVSAADPVTYVMIALLLTAVILLSSYLPARRATKVDPMVALRHE